MFLFASVVAIAVFLISLLKVFHVRKHPYTVLAFSGSLSFAIVTFELIQIFQFYWKSLMVIAFGFIVSLYCYSLFKSINEKGAKEIILKSLLPLLFGLLHVFALKIVFLAPMFVMCVLVQTLTPKRIKEQRRNLFVTE